MASVERLEERVRLAQMALAEIGQGLTVTCITEADGINYVSTNRLQARRAFALARHHMGQPLTGLMACLQHAIPGGGSHCSEVRIGDVIRDPTVLCDNAQQASQLHV